MIKLTLLFVSLILLMINIGCSPVGVLATGGSATMVVAEGDRSLGTVVDDATIKLNLSAKFLKSENSLFLDVNSNVTEGRVLLTGLVETQEIRIEAVRKFKIKSTPSIVINDKVFEDSLDYKNIKRIIEKLI